jgi:pimeloyl-[acyl-carrier protein] methyl ester esterase
MPVINVPILYLRASRDRIVPSRASVIQSRSAPAMRIIEIDGPHFLLLAKPAEAAAQVKKFMRELDFGF